MGKICPHCHRNYDNSHQFCSHCGTKLEEVKQYDVCPACGAELAPDDIYCSKCGTSIYKKYPDSEELKTNEVQVVSLVCLIVSIVAMIIPAVGLIGLVPVLIIDICNLVSKTQKAAGTKTMIILSIVFCLVGILFNVFFFFFVRDIFTELFSFNILN